MVYSLTNASALGLDLVRTPGGAEAAGVLLQGLLAPPVHTGPAPRAPADLAAARARALAVLGPGGPTVLDLTALEEAVDETGSADLALTLRRMLRRLGAVSFGTVSDLTTLAAQLPRTAPWPAGSSLQVVDTAAAEHGELLADAVLAALVRHREDPAAPVLARALAHRLEQAEAGGYAGGAGGTPVVAPAPPPGLALLHAPDPSPVELDVAAFLTRCADVPDVTRLCVGHGTAAHVWADHMHEAAWAVETTGRTRVAAAAQLDLVRCLAAAGISAEQALGGVWNTCSAAVQAHVVADVLCPDTWTVLTADLLDALGG